MEQARSAPRGAGHDSVQLHREQGANTVELCHVRVSIRASDRQMNYYRPLTGAA